MKQDFEQVVIKESHYNDGVLYLKCTKCKKWKPLSDFGLRKMSPTREVRNQSQCTKCRNSKDKK